MTLSQLMRAVSEAERFLAIAKEAEVRLRTDYTAHISGSKETAAAKRASMDLSRALTEMRRP